MTGVRRRRHTLRAAPLGHTSSVDPDDRQIEVAVPDRGTLRWATYGPGDVVLAPYGTLDVDQFYDDLDAAATT